MIAPIFHVVDFRCYFVVIAIQLDNSNFITFGTPIMLHNETNDGLIVTDGGRQKLNNFL